jgi:sugar transferase (PEP-CTERM/EpsH1 system associated)
MRILFLTHRLPYAPNRGDRIRAYHMLRVLSQHHHVHVVSLVHDDHESSEVDQVRAIAASVHSVRVPRARNLLKAAKGLLGSEPLTHHLLSAPAMGSTISEVVRRESIEVVLSYCTGVAPHVFRPPLAGLPYILDMVDVDSEKWQQLARTARGPLRWVYQREAVRLRDFERRAAAAAAATTVVSERERELAQTALGRSDIAVVGNGIDIDYFAPRGSPALAPHLVFCGVFSYAPNEQGAAWFADQIWPVIVEARPDCRLTLVGMHPTARLRRLTRDPRIRVTGAVDDVRPYLWQASLAVIPVQIARGVQNKVLEAVAAGLPAVVTPQVAAGVPAQIREACFPARDAREFARETLRLLDVDAETRRALARRVDLSALSWARQLEPLLQLVRSAGGTAAPAQSVHA